MAKQTTKQNTSLMLIVMMAIAALLVAACSTSSGPGTTLVQSGGGSNGADNGETTLPNSGPDSGSDASGTRTAAGAEPEQQPSSGMTGRLSITTRPLNADVFVDGEMKGKSPLVVNLVAYGTHIVSASKTGYVSNSRTISLASDTLFVEVNLTSEADAARLEAMKEDPGTIVFESRPLNAMVYLEGELLGTTPVSKKSILPGVYSYSVKKSGYLDYEGEVEVTGGQTVTVVPELVRD